MNTWWEAYRIMKLKELLFFMQDRTAEEYSTLLKHNNKLPPSKQEYIFKLKETIKQMEREHSEQSKSTEN